MGKENYMGIPNRDSSETRPMSHLEAAIAGAEAMAFGRAFVPFRTKYSGPQAVAYVQNDMTAPIPASEFQI